MAAAVAAAVDAIDAAAVAVAGGDGDWNSY